jgi:hypothetical protein
MTLFSRVQLATVVGFLMMASTIRISAAFDNEAHLELTQRAIGMATIDNFLKTTLGFEFPNGVNQNVQAGKTATALIREGVLLEDSIGFFNARIVNHFHNPKLSWAQAGLWPPGFVTPFGYSSVAWSQLQANSKSWQQARNAYFNALTSTTNAERSMWFADAFRLLGHAMHHVQDAAAPSHTRNDSHLAPLGIGDKDPFHSFAERPEILALIRNANSLPATSLAPSFLVNQPSPDPQYPVPIARLLDTTTDDIGSTALGNGFGIGIAEYSNANFFSDNTIFPETFPYPGSSNLKISAPELDPGTGKKKTYLFFKPGFGETNYRLAQASSLRNITGTNVPTDIGLDYKVFTDYAYKLFPRAIGYSAGLIDYFFRGFVQHGYYGVEVPAANGPPTTLTEQLWPPVFPEEQTGAGTVVAVLVYRAQDFTAETFPTYVISAPVTTNLTSGPQDVTFSFGSLPFPATLSGTVYYRAILVYRGPLGAENDAVIASPCDGADVAFMRFTTSEGERFYGGPLEGCGALPQ